MAREQDRETDRLNIQAETDSQRRQMLRYMDTNTYMKISLCDSDYLCFTLEALILH